MIADEAQLSAWADKRDERKYSRLLLNRVFRAAITAVNASNPPLYQIQIQRTGETSSDLAWYPCYEPGYTPSVGDEIDLMWRDDVVAYAIAPRGPAPLTCAWMQIGPPITLITDVSAVTLGSIPQSFQHLKLLFDAQTSNGSGQAINLQFNNDGGNVYYGGYANSTSSAGYQQNAGIGVLNAGFVPASASANTATNEVTVFDYTNTTRRIGMTFMCHSVESGSSFRSAHGGGTYVPTTLIPVTSLRIFPAAGNLVGGSKFWLYGIGHA